MDLLTLETRG
jgi:hypothetical protein